jgi:hypothetical protein
MKLVYQTNKMLLEDTISQSTNSDVLNLDGAVGYCIQADIDVNTPSPKTFDSPAAAALTFQGVTLTAQDEGTAGNNISIELLDTGVPSQALEVNVTGDAISVNLELDAGTASSLVNQGLTYTAAEVGVAGDSITLELADTGVPSQALEINVVGTDISVNLELDAGTASSLVEQDLTYTADAVGVAGDNITIAYIDDGTAGAETVNVTGTDIVVHMEAGVSTATQIKTAVDASGPASALISVAITGTGSNAQNAVAETNLAGGADPAIVTDADALKAALDLDVDVTNLISIAGTGAVPLVVLAQTPLAGGVDPAIVTTASQLVAAIDGDAPAFALVDASGAGGTPLTAAAADNLVGGVDSEVDIDDNTVTIPSHGFSTGLKGQLTSTGTLPAGLSLLTDYFIIVVDANTVKFATTLNNANAGTAVNLTDDGSGVATFTSTALAGANVKIQKRANEDMDWVDVAAATNITADVSLSFEVTDPQYRQIRMVYTMTAGQMAIENWALVKVLT